MKKYLFLLLCLCCSCLLGEIRTIGSFVEAQPQLQSLQPEALVLFDMHYVLVAAPAKLWRPNGKELLKELEAKYCSHLTQEQKDYAHSIGILENREELIEPCVATYIQDLQNRSIKVLVLTSSRIGPYGKIPLMEDSRVYALKTLQIDLSSAFPSLPHYFFCDLISERDLYPLFMKGCLFTNGHNNTKGSVLRAFLKKVQWKPSQIIFFDNQLHNLKNVEELCQQLEIPFVGYHYLSSVLSVEKIDPVIAKIQIRSLYEKEVWLSDEEAEKLLQKQPHN